jgi:molybdate transport system substrate-binding protein
LTLAVGRLRRLALLPDGLLVQSLVVATLLFTALAASKSWASTGSAGASNPETRIAVASNLRVAVDRLYPAFIEKHPRARLAFVFGSTGHFTTQILQGAPFAMLLAADEASVALLHSARQKMGPSAKLTRQAVYARGQLSLVVLKRLAVPAGASPVEVIKASNRTAVANPETAPYGRAAQQWLARQGLRIPTDKLAIGENIGQTAQFLLTGAVDAALLARSLTNHPAIAACCHITHLPGDGLDPIRQSMILLQPTDPAASAFFDFLLSPEAGTILRSFGYQRP